MYAWYLFDSLFCEPFFTGFTKSFIQEPINLESDDEGRELKKEDAPLVKTVEEDKDEALAEGSQLKQEEDLAEASDVKRDAALAEESEVKDDAKGMGGEKYRPNACTSTCAFT